MTRDELIDMLGKLKERKLKVKRMIPRANSIEEEQRMWRTVRTIDSICDRLCLNFNMIEYPKAREFLESTIAEAELFLSV